MGLEFRARGIRYGCIHNRVGRRFIYLNGLCVLTAAAQKHMRLVPSLPV